MSLSSHGINLKAFYLFFLSSFQSLKSKALILICNKPTTKQTPVYFYFFAIYHSSNCFLWSSTTLYSLNIPLMIFHLFGAIFILDLHMCSESVYQLQSPLQIYLVLPVLTQPTPAHSYWLSICLEKPQCNLGHHENTMPLPRGTLWNGANISILWAFKWCWGFTA